MKTIQILELKNERIANLHDVFTSQKENKVSASKHKDSIKGGVVCRDKSVVIKSNYEIAGMRRPDGSRPTKQDIGGHASQSLNYLNNHGNDDIKDDTELANVYDDDGERMTRAEFNAFRKELEDDGLQASRRTMISVGHIIERDDYANLIKESVDTFKDLTDKNFQYKFAIHTDHEVPHAHVFMHSDDGRDILINKEQMQLFKEIVGDKTDTLLKSLDKDISKDKEIEIKMGAEL